MRAKDGTLVFCGGARTPQPVIWGAAASIGRTKQLRCIGARATI